MSSFTHFDFAGPFLRRYDRFNHLASMGLDRYWRWFTARRVADWYQLHEWTCPVLDLACGTGDMAAALRRQAAKPAIFGSDPSAEMLELARQKKHRFGWSRLYVCRAVSRLPLRDASVGAITCAFGVRNFVRLREEMQECQRVLRPQGRMYLLDFYQPQNLFSHALLQLYKKVIAPLLGVALTGHAKPYDYLMASMYAFRTPAEMAELLKGIGMREAEIKSFFFGLVHLVIAEKI